MSSRGLEMVRLARRAMAYSAVAYDGEKEGEPVPSTSNQIVSRGMDVVPMARSAMGRESEKEASSTPNEIASCDEDDRDISCSDPSGSEYQPSSSESEDTPTEDSHVGAARENEVSEQRRSRKRKREPAMWKRNIRKRLRNTGRTYANASGDMVRQRERVRVQCKCHYKCAEVIGEDVTEKVFRAYWGLGDVNLQRNFVASHVTKCATKRGRKEDSKRKHTLIYTLTNDGIKVQVCRQFFLGTLAITEKFVRNAMGKITEMGIVKSDKRGYNNPRGKIPDKAKDIVRAHIGSIPVVESHYCRSQTSRKYLPGNLSVNKLYLDYLAYHNENAPGGGNSVKASMYREIFNTEYNYGFYSPKKDQCHYCLGFNSMGEEDRERERPSHESHIRRKEQARIHKATDKAAARTADSTLACYAFDLEKLLLTPSITVSKVYYKRKLVTYNFTVYDLATGSTVCYMWDETMGTKGSCEAATCLYQHLLHLSNTHIREVTFYSDTAAGQNRNSALAAMILFAVSTIPNLMIVNQKFMESGHSEMEVDSVHSAVEGASKKVSIHVPSDWCTIARTARRKNPYNVRELSYSEFLDFKELRDCILKNKNRCDDGGTLNWLKVKWFQYRKAENGRLFFKEELDAEHFRSLTVSGRATRNITPIETFPLKPCYKSRLPVSQLKHKDLMSLCKSRDDPPLCSIPPVYHEYYETLPVEE